MRVDSEGIFVEDVAEGLLVADFSMDRTEIGVTREECLANARVSAVAPTMLRVLQGIVGFMDQNSASDDPLFSAARAVIAKATERPG